MASRSAAWASRTSIIQSCPALCPSSPHISRPGACFLAKKPDQDRGRRNHERACESAGAADRFCHAELAAAAAAAKGRNRRPLLPARTLRSGPALCRAVRCLCRGQRGEDLDLPGLWPVREPRAVSRSHAGAFFRPGPALPYHHRSHERASGGNGELYADRSGHGLDRSRIDRLFAAAAKEPRGDRDHVSDDATRLRRARLSPLLMEMRRAQCALAPSPERLGFRFEGIFRQALVYKGRNRDTAWYSIIDREWPALKAAFERWLDPRNFDGEGRQRESLSALTRAAAGASRERR